MQYRAKRGASGVCFYRCRQCILVATHADGIQPGECRAALGRLGDFLKEAGM